MKLKLNKAVEDFFQVYSRIINDKYIYFPHFYKKLGNSEYEEIEFKDLPEGLKKYVKNQRKVEDEL